VAEPKITATPTRNGRTTSYQIALFVAVSLFAIKPNAWTPGELSIWMDPDRGHALGPILKKYTDDTGIKVKILESRSK
jgi:hypothetical protein